MKLGEIMTEKEMLIRLRKIMCEEKRRENENRLDRYNAVEIKHLKQIAFHKCDKKNRWVFGGNRSGKTECGAVETVWLARGIHPYKNNKQCDGWVVSLSQQVQRDVAQNKILSYLKKDWIALPFLPEIITISSIQSFFK